MEIANWEITEREDAQEISAEIDGFRLWYRLPKSLQVSTAGDPFVAAALLPAMLRGENLDIDPSLSASPKLLKNLLLVQEIHQSWNPIFKIIPIRATALPAAPLNAGVLSFFSGGVDSTYTFLKHIGEISHVVFIQGFDFYGRRGQTSTVSVSDLCDLAQLAYKLRVAYDPVSAFLKEALSATTLQVLSDSQDLHSDLRALEEALVHDLNRVLSGPSIYDAKRFGGIELRSETKKRLAQNPQGKDTVGVNRLLLEDAYPMEIARDHGLTYEKALERNMRFVQNHGKTLIPVETNHFAFGYRYNLSRNLTQGSALASIALLLGFPRVYVPAALAYDQLTPLGSHPLTDPRWSNEIVTIIHDGAEAKRVDKVIKIAGSESALANLRVCLNDMNINCGKCVKCLRTMVPLQLLRVSAAPFPAYPLQKAIGKINIVNDIERTYFRENYELAQQTDHRVLREALSAALRRYERLQLLKNVDRVLLGGLIKRAHNRREKVGSGIYRIDAAPPKD